MAYTDIVSSGMTVENEVIPSSGAQTIQSGGIALNTTIEVDNSSDRSNQQVVEAGGQSIGVVVTGGIYGDAAIKNDGGYVADVVADGGLLWGSGEWENINLVSDVWVQTYANTTATDVTISNGSNWEFANVGNTVTNVQVDNGTLAFLKYGQDCVVKNITAVNGATVNMVSTTETDGSINQSSGTLVGLYIEDSTFTCASSAWKMEDLEFVGSSWAQVIGGEYSNITISGTTQFEAIGAELYNVVVDGGGASYEIGDTNQGAQLIVFGSADSYAEKVVIQNGASAHVYNDYVAGEDLPFIEDVTVKDGGVLYLTNWSLDSDVAGEVWDLVVESGGTVYVGGDYSIIDTATFEKGSKLLGLKLSQGMYDVEVWDSYTNSYVTYDWKVGSTSVKSLTIVDGVEFGTGRTAVTITTLTVRDGGLVSSMYYGSTASGTIYGNSFSISNGVVTGWVVADGSTLYGDIDKYTVTSPSLQLVDVIVNEGGSLDGFRTGRKGDSSLVSNGTYVYDDGTVVEWSFGNGYAKNVVINGGCFVVQGYTAVGAGDQGETDGLVVNNGILVVANGTVNTNLTISGNTAMQVYGNVAVIEGTHATFKEGEQYYNFSSKDGVTENLVVVNGGFYYAQENSIISNSIFSGSRDVMSGNADYAESRLWMGAAGAVAENIIMLDDSRLDMSAGTLSNSTITGATVTLSGGTLNNVHMTDVDFSNYGATFVDCTLTGGSINLTGTTDYSGLTFIDMAVSLGTSVNDTFNGGNFTLTDAEGNVTASSVDGVVTGTFDGEGAYGFYVGGDVALKDVVLVDLGYNMLSLYCASIDGLTIDCDASWGCNIKANGTIKNLTFLGGWMDINVDINGLILDGDADYVSTSGSAGYEQTFSNVEIYAGYVLIGNQTGTWNADADIHHAENVYVTNDRWIALLNGSITNLTIDGGALNLYAGTGCDTWIIAGTVDLTDASVVCGSHYSTSAESESSAGVIDLDLTKVTSISINNTSFYTSVTNGEHLTIYMSGSNGFAGYGAAGYTMTVGNVVFDLADEWFSTAGAVWSDYSAIKTNSYTLNIRAGQGSYNLGNIGDVVSSITTNFGGQDITLTVGETVTVDGYDIAFSADGTITVTATASTNTALDWTTAWNGSMAYAVKYVNDIAGNSTVITLGNAMENAGGNGVNNAFGTISTGAIVTDDVTNSTIFGGSDSQDIATSWIKVTGGTNNVIYGGGNGANMTDGTNIDIYGGTTSAIFGAGKNSTTYVGENNAYAVNMDVKGGTHAQVNGGADNGFVVGDIAMYIVDIDVTSLFTGGGLNSSVDGNISIDINGYATSATWTGNLYGGAASSGVDTTVTGDIMVDIDGGNYSGMLFGGSYVDGGATATVAGTITIDVNGITQSDNSVFGSVSSSWVIGGGNAANATLNTSDVVVNVTDSTVGRIVGGSVASGSAVATVADVDITVTSSTVTGSIYAAGYTIGAATAIVNGDINVTINCTNSSLMGDIYLGGNNVGGLGSITVTGDATVTFTGSGDDFSFTGTVSGLGFGNTDIAGETSAIFDSYTGEFAGQIDSIDNLVFSGNTSMTFTESYETSSITFDVTDRTSTDAMVSNSNIDLADNAEINIVLNGSGSFEFDLMDVSDEDLTGVIANLFDVDGNSLGSLDITTGTILIDLNRVSFEIENGMLSIKSEGVLA